MERTIWWAGAGGMSRKAYSVGKPSLRGHSNAMVCSGPPYADCVAGDKNPEKAAAYVANY